MNILITHCWLSGFGGAEINVLQLAQYLKSRGDEVTVFTYWHEGEMVDEFKKIGVPVLTDSFNYLDTVDTLSYTQLNIRDYDVVWVCQQVIPISIVKQLNDRGDTKFIFMHMSSLIGIPVEAPVICKLEEDLASRILVISEESLDNNIDRIIDKQDKRIAFYRNPVPIEFREVQRKITGLRKIAVITNHPARELMDIEQEMTDRGVEIEYFGSWNKNYRLVDAEVIQEYDLVIGIGKNAQYCMVSGTPVYVYDYFGGPGFLNTKNYKKAQYYNFSGRGFERKSSDEIVDDIFTTYDKALAFHQKMRDQWVKEYSLDRAADASLAKLTTKQSRLFDERYLNYVISMQIMLHDKFVQWGVAGNRTSQIAQLEEELHKKNAEIHSLQDILASRKELIKRLLGIN